MSIDIIDDFCIFCGKKFLEEDFTENFVLCVLKEPSVIRGAFINKVVVFFHKGTAFHRDCYYFRKEQDRK